jgi:hypothetical protein
MPPKTIHLNWRPVADSEGFKYRSRHVDMELELTIGVYTRSFTVHSNGQYVVCAKNMKKLHEKLHVLIGR